MPTLRTEEQILIAALALAERIGRWGEAESHLRYVEAGSVACYLYLIGKPT